MAGGNESSFGDCGEDKSTFACMVQLQSSKWRYNSKIYSVRGGVIISLSL